MHANALEEGERGQAQGKVVRELEGDRADLEGWLVVKVQRLEIQNGQGKSRFCWRAVARNHHQV